MEQRTFAAHVDQHTVSHRAFETAAATFSTSMDLRRRWDFREKPESYRPAMDELKRFLPHMRSFLLPFDHRVELGKAAQTDAFLYRLSVAEVLRPQIVDGL